MKRLISTVILVSSIAFAQGPQSAPDSAKAATSEPIKVADIFTWARTTPPDWQRGALFAGLGLVGALVTIFGFIGAPVPGTAGKAKIELDEERLSKFYKRLEDLVDAQSSDTARITAVENAVNNLRDDIRAERWRQFGIAVALYALLGAFFSVLLAQDLLQALAIGAGWTGLIGTSGLKKDYEMRKGIKDAALQEVEKHLVGCTDNGNQGPSLSSESLESLKSYLTMARRL